MPVIPKNPTRKTMMACLVIFLVLIVIIFGGAAIYYNYWQDRIFPGVFVGNLNLGGKSLSEAEILLQARADKIIQEGFIFKNKNYEFKVYPKLVSLSDPDVSREIVSFNVVQAAEQAFKVGRQGHYFSQPFQAIKVFFGKQRIGFPALLDEGELESILKEKLADREQPAQNPKIEIIDDKIMITKENSGFVFDYDQAIFTIASYLHSGGNEPVEITTMLDYPAFKTEDTEQAHAELKEVIKLFPVTSTYKNYWWRHHLEEAADWFIFSMDSSGRVALDLDAGEIKELLAPIANEVNTTAQEAKFELENGRAVQIQVPRTGQELRVDESLAALKKTLIEEKKNKIELVVKETKPRLSQVAEDLGIQELIGRGVSNFSGSPPNRRHNIRTGANTLNGILIKPGEEFSLIGALGDINAATGYLPELVIRGDKTIPEYGGGLCQIGTTTFRAALYSGLKITERRNHSYRVRYYEPAGMDATIYGPHPDLRFINDTPAHILFITKIEGDDLIFEFYGTPDGREVKITEPKIFNIRGPGPTKLIETDELAPGQKKCTEQAHAGADAEFSRTIIPPQGESEEEVWKSHYVPWPAVCLIGKEEIEEELELLKKPD